MKCSLGISNFLEEISSLSHSIFFLYFFAVITEEGFLSSACYSLELCIQMGISFHFFFFFLLLYLLFFIIICKASSNNHFAFFTSFSWGWSWSPPPVQCHKLPFIVLQALYISSLIPWMYLSLQLYNCKEVTSKFGPGKENEAGQRLTEFCKENALVIANSLFQQQPEMTLHMDISQWLIVKSDWLYSLQLKWRSSIQSAKTRPGAECGSDSKLLIAKFRLKLKNVWESTTQFRYELNQIYLLLPLQTLQLFEKYLPLPL